MSVHTCIILVSMYLHCYGEFNVSPHMYYFSLYVSALLLMSVHTCIILGSVHVANEWLLSSSYISIKFVLGNCSGLSG